MKPIQLKKTNDVDISSSVRAANMYYDGQEQEIDELFGQAEFEDDSEGLLTPRSYRTLFKVILQEVRVRKRPGHLYCDTYTEF